MLLHKWDFVDFEAIEERTVAHHVVCDVQAEDSSFVVHETCRVGGEGGQGHVHHVVVLGRQGKGCGGERRLLVLPNVVELTL